MSAAACPGCGAADAAVVMRARAQLADLGARAFTFGRCAACGLVHLRDRVPPELAWALHGEDYPLHRGPAMWGPFAPLVAWDAARTDAARVALVRAYARLGPGATALDVGCGRPTFLARLARETGCRALGLDVVATAPVAGARVEVMAAPPERWPGLLASAGAGAIDVATFWHALEHDPAPVDTLRWLREKMAPGGAAVIEVPDLDGRTARWLGEYWPGWHTPRHASVFTPATLRAVVERAGWRVERHARAGTLKPYVLVALGLLDRAGFRFGPVAAPLVFPLWAAGAALTWPWLGRAGRSGMGLQTLVARAA